jgi:nicotinate-nucleotide adenylyltransferase
MSDSRKIGLFGGTFDPVHLGHIHVAEAASAALELDEVRFLPCRISPHKTGSEPTPARHRLEMLRLSTRDLPWAVVDELEVGRAGPSYSWQTAEEMRRRFPEARLFWIMGTDQWEVLHLWKHPERIAACVEFIVFARGQAPAARDGFIFHPVTCDHPASATAIREAIRAGRGPHPHPWLHPEVARWIRQHQLYQESC